ncbi:uncharacterized protein LOC135927093 [Gordionus sp. m RMFG-2023]|uniref:uncharacterized protein LOC135927093 n=1 Tax=Gordionus sp. m RMFG-2023 TaxID=3053472 RepID=UPI0031FC7DDA
MTSILIFASEVNYIKIFIDFEILGKMQDGKMQDGKMQDGKMHDSTSGSLNTIALLDILKDYKPAGINKHFNCMEIINKYSEKILKPVFADDIWDKLSQFYDLDACDERARMPFSLEPKDFSLPQEDYGLLIKKYSSRQNRKSTPTLKVDDKDINISIKRRKTGSGYKKSSKNV